MALLISLYLPGKAGMTPAPPPAGIFLGDVLVAGATGMLFTFTLAGMYPPVAAHFHSGRVARRMFGVAAAVAVLLSLTVRGWPDDLIDSLR